jgi:hypothetical protein
MRPVRIERLCVKGKIHPPLGNNNALFPQLLKYARKIVKIPNVPYAKEYVRLDLAYKRAHPRRFILMIAHYLTDEKRILVR